jgi:two-component system, cell cycle response regulator CtrA
MNIIIATSKASIFNSLSSLIKAAGFHTTHLEDAYEAASFARHFQHELIVIADKCNAASQLTMLQSLRRSKINTPIVVLLNDDARKEACRILDAGADDCIHHGISDEELISRIKAVHRRARNYVDEVMKFGRVEVNLTAKAVFIDGQPVKLTVKEYSLIEVLALNKNATVSKDRLMSYLYNGMDEPQDKIIDVFVCKTRKKFRDTLGGADFIQTVWGQGYMLGERSLRTA